MPVAFVVPLTTDIEAKLCAYLTDRLADYKRPSRIVSVDALPRNAGSKVERRALAARAADPA